MESSSIPKGISSRRLCRFRMCKDNILRVGVVVDKGKQAVKCLTDNKIYFPYSQDVLLFNENCIIKGLTSKIVEV